MSYTSEAKKIISNWTASEFLRSAVLELNNRDVVDVLNDLEALQELFLLRFEEAKQAWERSKSG